METGFNVDMRRLLSIPELKMMHPDSAFRILNVVTNAFVEVSSTTVIELEH